MKKPAISPKGSRPGSKGASGSETNQMFVEGSTNAYNWRSKFMANKRSQRSGPSRPRQQESGSPTDTSAEPQSAGSEKQD